MAKHCGWDKDFIAQRFTIDQLKIYYKYLNQIERIEQKRMAVAMRAAYLKEEDFVKFLDDDKGIVVTGVKGISQMKQAGIEIEEQ